MPWKLAKSFKNQFATPLTQGLGFDSNAAFDKSFQTADGPLAALIRDIRGFAPGIVDQANASGARMAAATPAAFDAYQNELNRALGQLGVYQDSANQGLGYAQQMAEQAFDPVAQSALFQEIAGNALDPYLANGAARGVLDTGGQAGLEQDVLTQIATQLGLQRQGDQRAAIDTLLAAGNNAAAMDQAGIPLLASVFDMIGRRGELDRMAYNAPMEASSNLLNLLSSGDPALRLLGMVAPVVAQKSKAWSGSGSMSGSYGK